MRASLFGGLAGLAIGAVVGWLVFDGGGIGIGISIAAATCGVLIAHGHEQSKK